MTPAISLRSVSKRFGQTVALSEVSLEVARGECLVVLGPSGSGKTTLLRLVAGLERLYHGEILLDGALASSPATLRPPADRRAGMVSQNLALWPHMTLHEHLDFALRRCLPDRRSREARIRWALELVNLEKPPGCYPGELSGGEQQRLALARALAPQPELLLLDEPFNSLDPLLKRELIGELSHLRKQLAATLLFVTHDPREAPPLADRVALLHAGALEQAGPLRELLERPATPFVKCFLATDSWE